MARVLFLQVGSSAGGVCALLQQSIRSVLSDYSQAVPEDLVDVLWELARAGLGIRNLTCNADPERQGILIYRREGDNLGAVALIKIPRKLCDGGCAVNICRFDKGNRIDTLEVKLVSSWN
jgi:hypothetical protein